MHQPVREFIARHAGDISGDVAEFASRYINGRVRDLFDVDSYIGVDLVAGEDVDVVADVTEWKPGKRFDAIVCCEVLEHTDRPDEIVDAAGRLLNPGGVLLLTCAMVGRAPHSGFDGAQVRDGEHYANVAVDDVRDWCKQSQLHVEELKVAKDRGDLYLKARKAPAKTRPSRK